MLLDVTGLFVGRGRQFVRWCQKAFAGQTARPHTPSAVTAWSETF